MPLKRYERNVGGMVVIAFAFLGACILAYVVWDALSSEDVGIEHVPISLWSSAIALFMMAVVYICLRVKDRVKADKAKRGV